MDRIIIMFMAMSCCVSVLASDGESLAERARELFATERINNPNIVYSKNPECVAFKKDWISCSDENTIAEVNRILVSALISFKVFVSTNVVDDGITMDVLHDRRDGLALPRLVQEPKPAEAKEYLLRVAHYLGSLRGGVYKRDPSVVGWRDIENERRREARIRSANIWLQMFRTHLLVWCGRPVVGLKNVLPRSEYGDFIRTFVKEGRLSENEIIRLLSTDILRESNLEPSEYYKTMYDNPLNWYEDNEHRRTPIEDRVNTAIRILEQATIEGETLSERLTACLRLDREIYSIQSEIWKETHNITNLMTIWRAEKRFLDQEADSAAIANKQEFAHFGSTYRTLIDATILNRQLAIDALNRARYSDEIFTKPHRPGLANAACQVSLISVLYLS